MKSNRLVVAIAIAGGALLLIAAKATMPLSGTSLTIENGTADTAAITGSGDIRGHSLQIPFSDPAVAGIDSAGNITAQSVKINGVALKNLKVDYREFRAGNAPPNEHFNGTDAAAQMVDPNIPDVGDKARLVGSVAGASEPTFCPLFKFVYPKGDQVLAISLVPSFDPAPTDFYLATTKELNGTDNEPEAVYAVFGSSGARQNFYGSKRVHRVKILYYPQ